MISMRLFIGAFVGAATVVSASSGVQNDDRLSAGTRFSRTIAGSEEHRYRIDIPSGSYLDLEVFQRGRDVAVSLVNSFGATVASTDNPLGGFGPESLITIVRDASPGHTLIVRVVRPDGPAGSYDLTVKALESATPIDSRRVEAVASLQRGELERSKGTAESNRAALGLFESAFSEFTSIDDRPHQATARLGVARAHDNLGDKKRALQEYADARSRYQALLDESNEAFTLNLSSLAHEFLGERDEAMRDLSEALTLSQRVGDVRVEALSTGNTGLIYYQTGDRTRAMEWYRRALDLHRRADNRRGEAVSFTNLATTYDAIGDKDTAIEYFQQAVALRRQLGEPRELAVVLNNMGVVYFSRDEDQQALPLYTEAISLWRAAGDRAGEAATLNNIANVQEFRGSYQEAIDLWSQALEVHRATGYRTGEAATLANRGRLFVALGEYEQARTSLARALELQRDIKNRTGEAQVLVNLASVSDAVGDAAGAVKLYEDGLTLMRAVSNRQGEASALQALGRLELGRGNLAIAEKYLQDSIALFKSTGSTSGEAVSTAHLGRLRLASGDRNAARTLLSEALRLSRSIGHAVTEAAVLVTMARMDRDAGDLESAGAHAQSALAIVEAQRSRVAIDELRATYLATVRDYYELAVDILMRQDAADPALGRAAAALQISERARARTLLDQLTSQRRDVRAAVDPELLRKAREVEAALNFRAERLRRLLATTHTQAEVDARNTEIATLTGQYRELEARLKRSSARYSAVIAGDVASVADLQHALDAKTAIVEYMLGDDRSFAWVMTRDGVRSVVLPSRRIIEDAARKVTRAVATPDDPAAPGATTALAIVALVPVMPLIDRPRLVIVPDGALSRVPFAALPLIQPGAAVSPLIERYDLATAPSASTVALLRADVRAVRPSKTLAVFADPVYSASDTRVTRTRGDGTAPGEAGSNAADSEAPAELVRLIGTRREATAIAGFVPADARDVAVDFAANRTAATSQALRDYRLLHFATHAIIDDVHPELSRIALSLVDKQGRAQDGFLRLPDIYHLDLSADLVVLSACQTALGREIRGEGIIGLTRGFFNAGARRVVASLWQVDDRATAELMRLFYAAMLGSQHQSPLAALRTAQNAMRAQSRWASPYYWAGFTLYGEWE